LLVPILLSVILQIWDSSVNIVTKLKSWIIWGLILAGSKNFSAFQKCSDQLQCPLGAGGFSCAAVPCLVHRADTAPPAAKVKQQWHCVLPLQVLVASATTARPSLRIFNLVHNCGIQLAVGAFRAGTVDSLSSELLAHLTIRLC
jgi:hypothetical protein